MGAVSATQWKVVKPTEEEVFYFNTVTKEVSTTKPKEVSEMEGLSNC